MFELDEFLKDDLSVCKHLLEKIKETHHSKIMELNYNIFDVVLDFPNNEAEIRKVLLVENEENSIKIPISELKQHLELV